MNKLLIIICSILTLCSCKKGGDYVDAIPSTATAIVAIEGVTPLLSDFEDIDTTKTTYLFELAGGEMGLCALDTDGDLLIMLLPATTVGAQEHQEKLIDNMKECDPENSIRHSELWKHLSEIKGNMRLVAQTNVLPKQMQAAMTLGCPKGTDPADVILETELSYTPDSSLTLHGHSCSYNERVKQEIGRAFQVFRPITFDWQKTIEPNTLLGIYMNVEGTEFMPLLQNNKALNMMLMGSNAYDRMRENHGNMAVVGTIDNKWSVETSIAPTVQGREKLVLCLNMQSLPKELANAIGFLTTKINKIVYKVE